MKEQDLFYLLALQSGRYYEKLLTHCGSLSGFTGLQR
jgi:hypothetical protein